MRPPRAPQFFIYAMIIATTSARPSMMLASLETFSTTNLADFLAELRAEIPRTFEPPAPNGRMPECISDGKIYCEDVHSYPHRMIQEELDKILDFGNTYFGIEEPPSYSEYDHNVGSQDHYVCAGKQHLIYPRIGKTKHGKWRFIVNQAGNGDYVQGILVELCTSLGQNCHPFNEEPKDYSTYCKQKFTYRQMLALSEDGELISDEFIMPLACTCAYKRKNPLIL